MSDQIDALSAMVTDNREASRFGLVLDGETAVLEHTRTPQSLVLVHTEVPPSCGAGTSRTRRRRRPLTKRTPKGWRYGPARRPTEHSYTAGRR
ncbi:MAG TPA: hypothetical protein VKE51_20450 [Vicinamibacterales bacterium]|nr:hypothetical protein [Vicinamibacterales bacterium]